MTDKPPTQIIRPPSIDVILEDPDWTPEAAATEQELRTKIVAAIRRKLIASGDLLDLRARVAEVRFGWTPDSLKAEATVSLVWEVARCCGAERQHPIHADSLIPSYHRWDRTMAAAIGAATPNMMEPLWMLWWRAARDALTKLGI